MDCDAPGMGLASKGKRDEVEREATGMERRRKEMRNEAD